MRLGVEIVRLDEWLAQQAQASTIMMLHNLGSWFKIRASYSARHWRRDFGTDGEALLTWGCSEGEGAWTAGPGSHDNNTA